VAGSAAAALWNLLPTGLLRKSVPLVSHAVTPAPLQSSVGLWVPIVLLADSIPQLYAIVDRHFGSYLVEGSIAALQYANLIAVLPVSICGLTLGTAMFPFLSAALQARDMERAGDIVDKAVRWSLIAVVPITVWLLFFCQEITRLLFERGAFNQESRLLTASTLMVYALGIIPNVLMAVLAKVFYSSRRWGPVILSSVLSVAVKWILSLWWVEGHGTVGLAAATAAGSLVGVVVFLSALPSEFTAGRWQSWARSALMLGAVCSVGSVAASGFVRLIPIPSHASCALVKLICGILMSAAIAYATASRLGLREVSTLKERMSRWKAGS
jgi:putative peptidoglycan lipid II flippase